MNDFNEYTTMWDNCKSCGKAVAFSYIHLPSGTCNACRPKNNEKYCVDKAMEEFFKKYGKYNKPNN